MTSTEALVAAVQARDLAKIDDLLTHDPDLANAQTAQGMTPLMLAVYFRAPDVTELLIARGATVTVFAAAALGDMARLRALLDADPTYISSHSGDGWTPLHLAAHFGHREAAALLLDRGADLRARSSNALNNTPLHAAVAGGQREVAATLLARGADASARYTGNSTALHIAAFSGDVDMVTLLLAHGADITAQQDDGKTPLAVAQDKGHTAVADLLRQRGAQA